MNHPGGGHVPPTEKCSPHGGTNGPPYPPSQGNDYPQYPPATSVPVGPMPAVMVCPSCRAQITSRMDYVSSSKTHMLACIICLVCCPFMCVPYCVDSCKNANHYCPSCNAYLGTYSG